jgi:hypothetical protein
MITIRTNANYFYGAEALLTSQQLLSHSRNSENYMESGNITVFTITSHWLLF